LSELGETVTENLIVCLIDWCFVILGLTVGGALVLNSLRGGFNAFSDSVSGVVRNNVGDTGHANRWANFFASGTNTIDGPEPTIGRSRTAYQGEPESEFERRTR
jgi:hypothetical protein